MRPEDHTVLPFSNLSGRGIRVAIIDSGVNANHPRIGHVAGGVDLSAGSDDQIITASDHTDRAGHGTACAGIIRRKAADAELFSIRIFDESLCTEGRLLVAALRWAIEHRMDVVNLSLGTTDVSFRETLSDICRQAREAGIILIAAEHNEGVESYPATFAEVIGVAAGKVHGRYSYFFRPGHAIECVARGDEQRLCWLQPPEIMAGGSSFAAPHIAAIAALIREAHAGASLPEVRAILQTNATAGEPVLVREAGSSPALPHATTTTCDPQSPAPSVAANRYDWIGKAALYPFSKEMHALVRYSDQLRFEIVGVADPVGKGLVGKDAGQAIGLPRIGVRIAPRLRDALEGADTLILGYVDELGRLAKRDLLRESILTALQAGVHVFSFLPVPPARYRDLHARAVGRKLKVEYPSVDPAEVQHLLGHPQRCGPVGAPVLGIFGTSAQQGKFTVQLALRREFQARGYKVGQIGTEHHSELFGMDFSFPIGYASPVDMPLQYYAPFLDIKLREICHTVRPDVVLVGAQSGTIPYDVAQHGHHCLPAIAFLLGTKPDACILAVNSIDADEYIRDTMEAIRSLVRAPTILLAMSDKEKHLRAAYGRSWIAPRQLSPGEIETRLRSLEDRFGLPSIGILSEDGPATMADTVIRHFSVHNKEPTCQTATPTSASA
jgi:uncharacterized NAD-dependent epimerase/dehydratase family protein